MATFRFTEPENFRFLQRKIGILAFPDAEALDITGPFEVFNFANLALIRQGICPNNIYELSIFAESSGPVRTLSGLEIIATETLAASQTQLDTLLIAGGDIENELKNQPIIDWIRHMSPRVRRLASVCTGAFLLAEAGLLRGRQATTHWHYSQQLALQYPDVTVDADRIFIQDGHIYTSGGITSGIDLALALVEEDWGRELALFVARFLVVFLKRPGGQSQFSTYLANEARHRTDLRSLQSWIINHINHDLRVENLAERMAMSPRNFARLFLAETGMTPAKFVEMTRIDQARHHLENTELTIEAIADKTGFKDPERMRRTFIRHLGVNPHNYRRRFSRAIPIR